VTGTSEVIAALHKILVEGAGLSDEHWIATETAVVDGLYAAARDGEKLGRVAERVLLQMREAGLASKLDAAAKATGPGLPAN
jgi:hypothetical protein